MICYNDEVFPVLMSMIKDKSQVFFLKRQILDYPLFKQWYQ